MAITRDRSARLVSLTPVERIIYHEQKLRRPDLYPDEHAILRDEAAARLLWHFGGSHILVPENIDTSWAWSAFLRQANFVRSAIGGQFNTEWVRDHNVSGESYQQGRERWWNTLRALWASGEAEDRITIARTHIFDLITAIYGVPWPLDWRVLPDADEARAALAARWTWSETILRESYYPMVSRTWHKDMWMIEQRWICMETAIEYVGRIISNWDSIAERLANRLERQRDAIYDK